MFEDLKNNIDFFIRNNTKFSRKNFVEKDLNILNRIKKENFYTKDVLSKYITKIAKNSINVLDIGCKNWFYAQAEFDFFNELFSEVFLDGVELDAYRLYSNFYSRYETAKFYTKDLKNTTYIPNNLLNINKKYDYIIWFLPFVVENPHIFWGLPKKYFYPKRLLKHAYNILNSNGQMLIINQGKDEKDVQEKFLKELNIPYTFLGKIESKYFQYKNDRYGFLIKK